MNSESPSIASSDRSPKRSPSDFMDSRNRGMFSRMLTVPTLTLTMLLTSWPMPVNPPAAMLFGIRYRL